jgi:hypothetical protein
MSPTMESQRPAQPASPFLIPAASSAGTTSGISVQMSRDTAVVSHASSAGAKLVIFRDDGSVPPVGKAAVSATPAPPKRIKHIRLASESSLKEDTYTLKAREVEMSDLPTKFSYDRAPHSTDTISDSSQLIRRLRAIVSRRSQLLHELSELECEENNVLAQLAPPDLRADTNTDSTATAYFTSPRPLSAPLLPRPTTAPSRLPRVQHPKTARKPLYTRTVSSPSVSTPLSARYNKPGMSKRIPLRDKTEDLPAMTESTATYLGISSFGLSSVPDLRTTRQMQVPTSFSNQPEYLNGISWSVLDGEARGGSERWREKRSSSGRSRSRSRGRLPATTGLTRGCEVPHTVARKK